MVWKTHKKRIIYTICIALYIVAIIAICRHIGIDSDKANHLLQADDIIHGNVFLKDWNLTGVTFLTTDLIFYEIADLIFGVGYTSIYVSRGLMIATILIVAYMIACVGINENVRYKKLLCLLVIIVPCYALINALSVHTGAMILCLVAFLLYYIIANGRDSIMYYAFLSAVIFMGTFGDLLMVVEGVVPIVILALYEIIISDLTNTKRQKK